MKAMVYVASILAVGFSASAGSLGKHDFSSKGWGTASNPCSVCHTPHRAQDVASAPLWNHTTTAQQFTPYASSTRVSKSGDLGATSKMCLSCHDGTVALDTFGEHGVMRNGSAFMPDGNRIGSNGKLSSDHPIAMVYDAQLAATKKAMATPASDKSVDEFGSVPLFNGKMECSSCHGVHDDTYGYFLRVDNTQGKLCLTCHLR